MSSAAFILLAERADPSTGSQANCSGQIADVHVCNTALPPADATAPGDDTAFTWLG